MKKSRSEIYSRALSEYVARHSPDEITEAMNAVLSEIDSPGDLFVTAAARNIIEHTEW